MQIGFMVEPQVGGTYPELLDLAHWAEGLGIDSFTRADHYLDMDTSAPTTDALSSLAGLARDTETIKLTVLVTPVTFRHPAIIAKTAATIHEMSGGRFELGVGTGWMETEHERFGMELGPLGQRFDRLEEALQYLWAATGRARGGFTGTHFSLADMEVLPSATDMPIIIGGGGMKRTPTLAGRFADEYNMFVTDLETLGQRLAVMRAAAEDAGRDPGDIQVSMVTAPVVAEDEDGVTAALTARATDRNMELAEYREFLATRNVPHGTPDQLSEQYRALRDAGVGRIYLQEYGPLDGIDRRRFELAIGALRSI